MYETSCCTLIEGRVHILVFVTTLLEHFPYLDFSQESREGVITWSRVTGHVGQSFYGRQRYCGIEYWKGRQIGWRSIVSDTLTFCQTHSSPLLNTVPQ
ncbi:hypothetical protein BgiBS90_013951 [Biomphalaria glabrata]|nr:hypothetical protein BgiBS90_013951 [Biomphalaria glabrata]